MSYVAIIAGLLIMCVPDDAGVLRTFVQGGIGLTVFFVGIATLLEKNG